jgi:hypothetical protein
MIDLQRSFREPGTLTAKGGTRSRLRYGVNEAAEWREFALGGHREAIRDRLRAIDTQIIRIYAFDRYTPDTVRHWPKFARYVQAVLDAGAVPMITFTRFRPPFDDASTVRWFAQRCGELAWNCIEQWGGEAVREWYWCVWDEPNSEWINPGFTFDQYRRIYLETVNEILRWIGGYLGGRRPLIGGPAIDTFQPFWSDWLWQFVHEIDNSLIGFVLWHRFGDWRAPGEWAAPRDLAIYRDLLMMRTYDYFEHAETVRQLTDTRGIMNICGKLNVNSNQELSVSAEANQSIFGAVYYTLALVQLMRGGADAELYWMGTDGVGPYGLWDDRGRPTPVFLAKQMVVRAIRPDDEILIEEPEIDRLALMVLRAKNADTIRSALIVHFSECTRSYRIADLLGGQEEYVAFRKIDAGTGSRVVSSPPTRAITFDGPGLATAMTARWSPNSRAAGDIERGGHE